MKRALHKRADGRKRRTKREIIRAIEPRNRFIWTFDGAVVEIVRTSGAYTECRHEAKAEIVRFRTTILEGWIEFGQMVPIGKGKPIDDDSERIIARLEAERELLDIEYDAQLRNMEKSGLFAPVMI